ncbi:MAG: hypothetical protein OXG96_16710 [Acidobacteria bacterium]|nr:hypothetical protein [Acidobacteriota bacterium]
MKYRHRFFGPTGRATKFEFGKHGRFSSVLHGGELLGTSIDTFRMTDTGAELLTGAAMQVEDGDGCLAAALPMRQSRQAWWPFVDIFFWSLWKIPRRRPVATAWPGTGIRCAYGS